MTYYKAEAWDIMQYLFKVKKINDHILHFAAEFSSRIDYTRMKQAVGILADAFPLIRCGFDETRTRPVWVDKNYTADEMLSLIESENVSQTVNQFLCQEVNLENGPQIKIGIIRNNKTDTLCIIINHMLCDAAGFKEVLYALGSIYTNLEKQTEFSAGSMIKHRNIGQILKEYSIWDRMKILCSKIELSSSAENKFNFQGDFSNPFIEIRKIPASEFRLLKIYAKKHSASINDVMMTACLKVLFRTFGRNDALPCTIDLRRFLKDRNTAGICNMMTAISCNIGLDIGESFESTLYKVKYKMDSQKTNSAYIKNVAFLEMLFNVLPYKTAKNIIIKYFNNAPISFTNIGIIDKDRLAFGDSKMIHAFMTGSIKYNPSFQMSLSTFDDEAVLCVNFRGTQNDRLIIANFLNDFVSELQKNAMQ